jgi:predicted DNA-binding transcriptional regulator YafY
VSRGDSLTRQLKLWMLLLEDRELSVETAAVRLDCTRRTIYRDLEVLQRAGMPLYQETAGRRVRWRLMEGFHRELSVQFSVQEAMALVAGEQFLAALRGTVFAEAAQSAVGKVRQALAPALRQRLELISRHVSATGAPTRALGDHRAHLDALLEAIEHTQVVELEYRKLNSTRAEHYTFEPHHVHVQGSSVYVVGWVIERAAPRVFLLDRVEAVKPTTKKFTRRPEIGPGLFSQGAFGLWDGKVARVRLKFRGTAATIVEEQQFHASQRTERQADGSLLLELAVPPSPSLKAWVRGFGKRVEVLEPKDLLAEP